MVFPLGRVHVVFTLEHPNFIHTFTSLNSLSLVWFLGHVGDHLFYKIGGMLLIRTLFIRRVVILIDLSHRHSYLFYHCVSKIS